MKTFSMAALATAAALLAMPAQAQDSPVVGTWNTQARTDFGTFASTMTVAHEGGVYSVTMVDQAPAAGGQGMPPMESSISGVSVDGNSFTFKRSLTTPQGPMELSYSGSVDGDSLTAEVASSFGNIPVTGTRAD